MESTLLILSADPAFGDGVNIPLAPLGWRCPRVAEPQAVLECVAELRPAAILCDLRENDVMEMAASIRQLPVPLNGTPILTAGSTDAAVMGAARHLDASRPADALLDLLRQWAGPLEDHVLRREPWGFRYRLIRLLGLDAADAMLLRLRESLATAMEALAADGQAVAAHRLAGAAGMCGFAQLGELWSRVSHDEDGALGQAVEASRAAIVELDAILGAP